MSDIVQCPEKGCEYEGTPRSIASHSVHDDELRRDIVRVSKEFCGGTAPTQNDLEKHSYFSKNTFCNRFGNHNDALKECGFTPNKEMYISRESLLNDILNIKEELGEVPSQGQMEKHGEYGITTIKRRFGKWTNAVKEAGLKPVENAKGERHAFYDVDNDEMPIDPYKPGEEHERWMGGHKDYYGSSWYSIKEKAMKRANGVCEFPNCKKEKCETGESLHCHHIIPNRLTDSETEHDLENLIVLCREHHIGENGIELRPELKTPMY